MTKAIKDHVCTLCFKTISNGTEYVYETITIWDHPANETFGVYKAHKECDDLWLGGIGKDMDWCFPADPCEWEETRND